MGINKTRHPEEKARSSSGDIPKNAGKAPAFQFYAKDWISDPDLQSCSLESQGLFINLLARMHLSSKPGYLLLGGAKPSIKALCKVLSVHHKTLNKCLKELLAQGPLKQDSEGVFCCSRMVRDRELDKINKANGSLGGNPALINKPDNPRDNPPDKASSASSSSSASPSLPTESSDTETVPSSGETVAKSGGPLAGAIQGACRSLIDGQPGTEPENGDKSEEYAHEMFFDLWPHGPYEWNAEKYSLISEVKKCRRGPFNVARDELKELRREGKVIHNELAYLIRTAQNEHKKMHGSA